MEIWALRNNSNEPTEMLKQAKFDSRIDTDLLVGKIIEVCGNMTPVHNTTDSFLYFHKLFFKMWEKQISKLLDTMDYEYEPLDNYRRSETLRHGEASTKNETEGVTGEGTSQQSSSDSREGSTNSSSTNNSTAEHKTSAYNESLYQPESQDTENGTETGNTSKSESGSSNSSGLTTSKNDRTLNDVRTASSNDDNDIHGLNGLFTTQQLIKQEREIAEFNVYQWIVTKYMEELFICVF